MITGEPLRHGYTNHTVGAADTVVKTYLGSDARERRDREHDALIRVADRVPVPRVLEAGELSLTMERLPGTHGQDLIDAGHGAAVLRGCGVALARIHAADDGLVHGDYGPNNVLFDPVTFEATAVLDWEWSHVGSPVEDLAWCEWIVRMHHPPAVRFLDRFFTTYGAPVPAWPERQAEMVRRCAELTAYCRRADPGGQGELMWAERTTTTALWTE